MVEELARWIDCIQRSSDRLIPPLRHKHHLQLIVMVVGDIQTIVRLFKPGNVCLSLKHNWNSLLKLNDVDETIFV